MTTGIYGLITSFTTIYYITHTTRRNFIWKRNGRVNWALRARLGPDYVVNNALMFGLLEQWIRRRIYRSILYIFRWTFGVTTFKFGVDELDYQLHEL